MTRVLVVEDSDHFATALEGILAGEPRLQVIARAANGQEAIVLALSMAPDVILMDLNMPHTDGIEATRRLRELGSRAAVLILSGSATPTDSQRALQAGAVGFLQKDRAATELLPALLEVASRLAPVAAVRPDQKAG